MVTALFVPLLLCVGLVGVDTGSGGHVLVVNKGNSGTSLALKSQPPPCVVVDPFSGRADYGTTVCLRCAPPRLFQVQISAATAVVINHFFHERRIKNLNIELKMNYITRYIFSIYR